MPMDDGRSFVFYRDARDDYPMLTRADGYRVWDQAGTELIDLTSGLSSTALIGQGRMEIADAFRDQVAKIGYIHSSGATNPAQELLAERLIARAPNGMARVMFSSGGSEANEIALRIVRQYHLAREEPQRSIVIGLHPSYHGATAGALSVTGRWDLSGQYRPYLFDARHVPAPIGFRGPFRDMRGDELADGAASALEAAIESIGPEFVAAFIAEPVSLSTGLAVPPETYFERVRHLCSRYGILFIGDEVITAMGRTGSLFRWNELPGVPDIVTIAKGLSGGYSPLGATIVSDAIVDGIGVAGRRMAGVHTHSGAPIPCAIGNAVLDVIEREELVPKAGVKGALLRGMLDELVGDLPFVGEIRGVGMMVGVEYVADKDTREKVPVDADVSRGVTRAMWSRGYLSRTMHHRSAVVGDCTGFLPSLTIGEADMEAGVSALRDTLLELAPEWNEAIRSARRS